MWSGQKRYHFPLPFIDERLERLGKHSFFYFLDGYSGIIKFLSTLTTKVRPTSHAPMGHMHTYKCLLIYAMPLFLSKGA
jgi:hypothetical protein